ncbi:hypothetical protein B0H14DRAFT_2848448 [Mycena olivaceomarginata]|nr:hypothetical protein B0H14DRAFT_2848448 [Mycena olivaceomarginata]
MEQNASAHTVLRIQEICDYITDFLHSSSTDLNSCALISRLFTAPAQYHLFSDIDATWYRFGDPSVAASASQRLCTVLLSPHLVCLVRRLRLSLCPEIIVPLAQVRFTRLETLRLEGGPTMARVSDKTLSLAAGIVGLPSIRCVQFVSVVLNDIESLGALFRQRSTLDRLAMDNTIITSASPVQPRPFDAGQHRVVLNSVEITDAMGTAHDSWVVHALCPFDFSAVTNMNIAVETSLKMIGVMHSVAPSLTTLKIDATFATPAFRLSAFPALTTLTVLGWYRGSAPAAALLESVGSKNVISQLYVRIALLRKSDAKSLCTLDEVIANLPLSHLRTLQVTISRNESNWTGPDAEELFVAAMQGLRGFFPHMDTRGYLRLAYLRDGVQIKA